MEVDLIYVNENTPKGKVNKIECENMKIAKKKFEELNSKTKIKYAYLRHFDGWRDRIVKWYKEKNSK